MLDNGPGAHSTGPLHTKNLRTEGSDRTLWMWLLSFCEPFNSYTISYITKLSHEGERYWLDSKKAQYPTSPKFFLGSMIFNEFSSS